MIIQACLNGARQREFHPRLPVTAEEIAAAAAACVRAGAGEIHVHCRRPDGRESLAAVDAVVPLLRRACPGTLIGVSTGAWIEGDEARTLAAIGAWQALPDHASVNLSEPGAPAVMECLRSRGVAVEAGLASAADAERFAALAGRERVLRVLVEIEAEQEAAAAREACDAILAVLRREGVSRPILLHGFDATVWPLARLALERGWSTRVGLEDGDRLPDGTVAPDNAALVAAAVALRAE
ncbi:3-keto-5-aminohexanoate cleavage protein [Lutibaculum baratangense]|uniref:3-keto-5-aminohexanoate cleavage enzyme n=1 Tax=Lutibaculum baratangense AMV1 TaxID=631454 RepID=V4RPJ7_9HYPH|nr:3-keto-5-aminohexanoate cleavage protein [Lutibaculum baratangense]ESR27209.1 hypothetical protein N177_0188 [Lutibaculum baratangense AMV1]